MGKRKPTTNPSRLRKPVSSKEKWSSFFQPKKIPAMLILQNNNILRPCLSKIDLFLEGLAFWQPKKRAAKKVATKTDILKEPPCCRAGRWSTLTLNKSDLGVTILIYRLSPSPQFFTRKKKKTNSQRLQTFIEPTESGSPTSEISRFHKCQVPPLLPCQKSDLQFESSAGRWENGTVWNNGWEFLESTSCLGWVCHGKTLNPSWNQWALRVFGGSQGTFIATFIYYIEHKSQ